MFIIQENLIKVIYSDQITKHLKGNEFDNNSKLLFTQRSHYPSNAMPFFMHLVEKFELKLLLLNPNNSLNYKNHFHLNLITIKF